MSKKPYIPLLLGSGREGRFSEYAAKYLMEKLVGYPLTAELCDVRDLVTPFTIHHSTQNEQAEKWRGIAAKADGFILVFPEYNHGYPGEMKIVLDQALEQYARKPVLLAGIGGGAYGGARGVENLLPVLRELGLIVLKDTLYFPNIKDLAKKDFSQWDDVYQSKIDKAVENLVFFASKSAELRGK